MSELKSNVIVTFESRQISNGEEERTTITVPGYKTEKNGQTYIYYSVYYDEDRKYENKELVKIKSTDSIEIMRTGLLKSKMVFKTGETTVTDYQTPAGHLFISILTEKVDIDITDTSVKFNMNYRITLDDDADILVYFKFSADEKEI